jgi:glucose-6-phosphate isomerase
MNYRGLDKYDKEAFTSKEKLIPYLQTLKGAKEATSYNVPESFLRLPFDGELFTKVSNIVLAKKSQKLRYVFLAGIGGSSLGAQALYDVVYPYENFSPQNHPVIIFVDSINTDLLSNISNIFLQLTDREECLLLFISKSGSTTETVTDFSFLTDIFTKRFGAETLGSRSILITDETAVTVFPGERVFIPTAVGGRFSVFSAVGLVPLLFAGIPVALLLERIKTSAGVFFEEDEQKNPALSAALAILQSIQKGYTVYDHFFFNSELESLGKWCRQLIAESLGKNEKISLLPTVSIGTNDLHSVFQRTLGGKKDIVTDFVFLESKEAGEVLEAGPYMGKSPREVNRSIYTTVKTTYQKEGLLFIEHELNDFLDIGVFMYGKMVETLLLAKLLEVDPFGQPAVEMYKKETKI